MNGVLAALILALAACGSQRLSVAPSTLAPPASPAPPAPPAAVTLSGTAFEHTAGGARALPNLSLLLYTRGYPNPFLQVTTDATGQYSISDSIGGFSIAPTPGSGYYAPCPNGRDVRNSDRTFDVHVVSEPLLSTTGVPASMPLPGPIWVSGKVFESTAQGPRPVAGALVNLEGSDRDPRVGSTTLTDAAGRYLVCPPVPGTGTDQAGLLRVRRDGYQMASRVAVLGSDLTVDIELVRD